MKVRRLSGGEQSRLLLARLMLRKTNLLVLDEPTNDLDLATLQVLEDCLADFPGAVILVTHDRYFLDRVTNRILAFARDEKGQGDAHGARRPRPVGGVGRGAEGSRPRAARREIRREAPAKKRRLGFNEQRELDGIEARIQAAEAARDALREESEHPAHASDAPKLVAVLAALEEKQAEVDRLYARWAELEEK